MAPTVGHLVIVNARVWTGDTRRPWADAIAIEGERVKAVGSSAEIMKLSSGARVIDARGATVVPGVTGGVLKAGMPADLVMADRDTAPVSATELPAASVQLTITGGTILFER